MERFEARVKFALLSNSKSRTQRPENEADFLAAIFQQVLTSISVCVILSNMGWGEQKKLVWG